MRELADGRHPAEIGKRLELDETVRETVVELVTASPAGILLADFGDPLTGRLLRLTAAETAAHGLPEAAGAIVYWQSDAEEHDSELAWLKDEEAQFLLEHSTSTAVGRIIAHYRDKPGDDGHPGHQIHRIAERFRSAL